MNKLTRTQIAAHRQSVREAFRAILGEIGSVLFTHDPIPNRSGNTADKDEYELEAQLILSRLNEARGPADVRTIAYEAFQQTSLTEVDELILDAVASEIWLVWQGHQSGAGTSRN